MTEIFRQGDVLLVRVEAIPTGAKEAARDPHGRIVLAEGEAHGHAHAIRNQNVTSFVMHTAEGDVSNRAMADYILVGGSGASLKHELLDGAKADHDQIDLEPGAYKVVRQREYTAPITAASPRSMMHWD